MGMTDPIADMLTRIRNSARARHQKVSVPWSRVKENIVKVLIEEGYLKEQKKVKANEGWGEELIIALKFDRENRPIMPDFLVDVGKVFELKKTMLAEHKSQRDWLRQHHGIDEYLEIMERWTRAKGGRAGVDMAEGFRHYKGHPYPESPRLEELLGGAVVRPIG